MPPITLLTDFGLQDEYVGVMKGVIHSIFAEAVILDVTHGIEPQDITEAAYLLNAAYPYFPAGTIHVVVVDPGVGGSRKIVALKHRNAIFLAPDNGVLGLIISTGEVQAAYQVEQSTFFLETVSNTFHGRDIFAPVAAHLAKGAPLEAIGRSLPLDEFAVANIPGPRVIDQQEIIGTIVSVDRFGNLLTSINTELLDELSGENTDAQFSVILCGMKIDGLSCSYDMGIPGEAMAIIGSRDLLEISVSMGNACITLNCRKGDEVRVRLT